MDGRTAGLEGAGSAFASEACYVFVLSWELDFDRASADMVSWMGVAWAGMANWMQTSALLAVVMSQHESSERRLWS